MFRAVKIFKNADSDKISYSGYGTGFGSRSVCSILNFDWGKLSLFLMLIWAHLCILIKIKIKIKIKITIS